MVKHAIIIGTHINAVTIVRSLKESGFPGKIILACGRTRGRGLAGFSYPDLEYLNPSLSKPEDLIGAIKERFAGTETAVLFTDERFHVAFSKLNKADYPWLHYHIGGEGRMMTVLDRLEFCTFLSENGVKSVPVTIPGDEDPFAKFGGKFVVRPRCSWYGFERFSVHIVESKVKFEQVMAEYKGRGLSDGDICYQELLSIRDEDNVSVCGWYDKDNQYVYCTHKVLQHPPKNGNGDVIEVIDPPKGVMEMALKTLSVLEYDGPFELEFVYDDRTNVYRIIELNPRFWMQHGLCEALSGNALSSLSVDGRPSSALVKKDMRYWVNPMYAIFRILRGDFRGLAYLNNRMSCLPISFWKAFCFIPVHMLHKIV